MIYEVVCVNRLALSVADLKSKALIVTILKILTLR